MLEIPLLSSFSSPIRVLNKRYPVIPRSDIHPGFLSDGSPIDHWQLKFHTLQLDIQKRKQTGLFLVFFRMRKSTILWYRVSVKCCWKAKPWLPIPSVPFSSSGNATDCIDFWYEQARLRNVCHVPVDEPTVEPVTVTVDPHTCQNKLGENLTMDFLKKDTFSPFRFNSPL